MRFIRELYEAVKAAIGNDIVVGARVEMDSKLAEGLQQDEALEALQVIEKDGVIDYFNLNGGRSDTDYMLASHPVPAMFVGLAPFVQLAGLFKSHLNTPTIHAARILILLQHDMLPGGDDGPCWDDPCSHCGPSHCQ